MALTYITPLYTLDFKESTITITSSDTVFEVPRRVLRAAVSAIFNLQKHDFDNRIDDRVIEALCEVMLASA